MPDNKRNPWRAMVLVSVISSYVIGSVLAGVFIGLWLGDRFGAKPFFLIVSLLVWLGVGFYVYLRRFYRF